MIGTAPALAAMPKTRRVILSTMLVELVFAALWYAMARYGAGQPDPSDAGYQDVVNGGMLGIMGAFLTLGMVTLAIAVQEDRKAAGEGESRA